MVRGWRNISFTFVASLVTPAMAENSPAERVVGIEIWRTVGGLTSDWPRIRSMSSGVRTSFDRQSWTALAASVIEPPPRVTIRSARASRACSAAATTALRGECAGILSKVPTHLLPSARRSFSISSVWRFSVPLTIRKTRFAPWRSTSSDRASAAGRPNTTSSILLKTIRPEAVMLISL